MHCVLCSTLLHATNQAGIVCQECKRVLEGKRKERGQAIRVRFCAGCSKPYHPVDDSIRHRACGGSASTARAFSQKPLDGQEEERSTL